MLNLLAAQEYRLYAMMKLNPTHAHVRLREWRSSVCSAVTKQTAKSTCGPIGFLNDLARSPRESKWAKREQVLLLIPLSKFAAFASPAMVGG